MKPKIQNKSIHQLALVCTAAACLFMQTTAAYAATNDRDAYIDSVYSWGIWELGLEPASGPQASANKAMNDRSKKLLFRPNDNAAYINRSIPVPQISTITPPPAPVAPLIPVIGLDGSGPVIPGTTPTAPNRRR
jgi:hypothetical protein